MAFSTPACWIFRLWLRCGFPPCAAATASVSQLKGDLHQTKSVAGTGQPFPLLGPEAGIPRPDRQLQPCSLSQISLLPKHCPTLGQSSSTCWCAGVWWAHTLALGRWAKSTTENATFLPSAVCTHLSKWGHGEQTNGNRSCSQSHPGRQGNATTSTLRTRNRVLKKQLFMSRENLWPGAALNPQVFFYSSCCETWIFWRKLLFFP